MTKEKALEIIKQDKAIQSMFCAYKKINYERCSLLHSLNNYLNYSGIELTYTACEKLLSEIEVTDIYELENELAKEGE